MFQGTVLTEAPESSELARMFEQMVGVAELDEACAEQSTAGEDVTLLESHCSPYCWALTAACTARCFSMVLPAIRSSRPTPRNMASARMVTTTRSSMVVMSTMPSWVDLRFSGIVIAPSVPAHDANDAAEGDGRALAR